MGAEYDAEVVCDPVGTAVHDGGICATVRDLGRFGQLILDDGASRTVVVKMSSWPAAQDATFLAATLRACAALSV